MPSTARRVPSGSATVLNIILSTIYIYMLTLAAFYLTRPTVLIDPPSRSSINSLPFIVGGSSSFHLPRIATASGSSGILPSPLLGGDTATFPVQCALASRLLRLCRSLVRSSGRLIHHDGLIHTQPRPRPAFTPGRTEAPCHTLDGGTTSVCSHVPSAT